MNLKYYVESILALLKTKGKNWATHSIDKVEDALNNNGNLLSDKFSNEVVAVRTYEHITYDKYPKWLVDNQNLYQHLIHDVIIKNN